MIKSCLKNWQNNKERDLWMNPPFGAWSNVNKDDIILVDIDGSSLVQTYIKSKSIKEKWNDLVFEADNNLIDEDNAANRINAIIKGYCIRKCSKYILLNEIIEEK